MEADSDDDFGNFTLPILSEDEFVSSVNLSSDTGFIPGGSSSSFAVSTPKKLLNPRKRATKPSNSRFQCSLCGNRLTTEKGLQKHLLNHRLEDAARRRPSLDSFRQSSIENAVNVSREILDAPVADTSEGVKFKNLAELVNKNASPVQTVVFCEFVNSIVKPVEPLIVSGSRALFPSSLKKTIRGALQRLIVSGNSRSALKSKLLDVTGAVDEGLPEKYLQEFCRRFTNTTAAFMIKLMREAPDDPHEQEKRSFSADNFDSLFSQQVLHRIAGYSIKAALRMSRQHKKSKRWQDFQKVLLECFATVGTCAADPQDKSYWTALLARKSLVFVNDKALQFFIEVAKVMCYTETSDGSLLQKDVLKNVMASPGLMVMWDNVISGKLSEGESLCLMRSLVQSLCGTFGKGIMLRRMNKLAESKRGGVSAVGLRGTLTR